MRRPRNDQDSRETSPLGLSHVDGLVSFEIVSGRGGHDRREKFDARMGLDVQRGKTTISFVRKDASYIMVEVHSLQ